jgi:hypothetical protein
VLCGCQIRSGFSGRICRAPTGYGYLPAGQGSGESSDRGLGWSHGGLVPWGKTTSAQCTGRQRMDPAPGHKPRIDLPCLLALIVAVRTDACTLTPFGAGGRLDWLPISPSLFLFPPVDRCGHTRVSPQTLGVGQCQGQQKVLEAKMC